MTSTTTHAAGGAYKSLLYWRKNLWNGSDCVPVILALENNVLSIKAADGTVVFADSLDQVSVKFTGWGTMILTRAGKDYDIVGMPAATSPAISDLQKAELSGVSDQVTKNGAVRDTQPAVLGGTVASAAGPTGASVVGAAVSTAVYYNGLSSIREWKNLIGSPADRQRKMSYMTWFILGVIIFLVGAIVIRELNI